MLSTPEAIIVGNGQSIRARKRGRKIDGFAYVIRLNNFCIRGFEPWVGSKRTIHVRRFLIRPRFARLRHVVPPEENHGIEGLQDDRYDEFAEAVIAPINRKQYEPHCPELALYRCWSVMDWRVVKQCRRDVKCAPLWPSTGALAVAWALTRWPSVAIVGFDCLTGLEPPERFGHWFAGSQVHPTIQGKYHDFIRERNWISRLWGEGKVVVVP